MDSGPEENAGQETERLSWAGYFGAATGLAAGVMIVELLAALLFWLDAQSSMAEVVWEIGSPLAGILGAVAGSFTFHRIFRGQVWAPATVFLMVLLMAAVVALNWIGFPWRGVAPV